MSSPVRARVLSPTEAGAAFVVAGLSVAERTRRALDRAGFPPAGAADESAEPTLFVAGDAVIDPAAASALSRSGADAAIAAEDALEAPAALFLAKPGALAPAPRSTEELAATAAKLRAAGTLSLVPTAGGVCQRVRTGAEATVLERRLLAALVQPGDGFFARHFDRRISSWLSPRLVRRGLTPNAITLGATAVGLLAASLLATQSQAMQIVGALLFIASTILDGCDGEVARLSFTSSEFGRRLDLACDNVVNAAVFLAIGFGALRGDPDGSVAVLVAVTLAGFALATLAGWAFSRWLARTGSGDAVHALYESLASRDFAYFVLLLALVGRLHWFVGFAAFGSYAFVAFLAVVYLRARRRPGPPPAAAPGRQWA